MSKGTIAAPSQMEGASMKANLPKNVAVLTHHYEILDFLKARLLASKPTRPINDAIVKLGLEVIRQVRTYGPYEHPPDMWGETLDWMLWTFIDSTSAPRYPVSLLIRPSLS